MFGTDVKALLFEFSSFISQDTPFFWFSTEPFSIPFQCSVLDIPLPFHLLTLLTSGLWLCSLWHPLPKGFHLDSMALDTNYNLIFSTETSSLSTNHSCHCLTYPVECFIKSSNVTLISYMQIGLSPNLPSQWMSPSFSRSNHRLWSLSWFLPFPQILLPQRAFFWWNYQSSSFSPIL